MSSDSSDDRTTLNEHQQRHLLVSCQHIDKLLDEIEQIARVPRGASLFPRHTSTLTPVQRKVLQDYLARIRTRLLAVLEGEHLTPPAPHGQDNFAIRTTLTFIDIAVEELRPRYMRGYGPIPDALVPRVEGIVDELRTIVGKLNQYLSEDPGRDLQARLARLEQGRDDVQSLKTLERIITAHGLVEFRPRLTMLVERASSRTFEIAVFGRVSSGKSSLLNYILETPVLPVGVTPVTAVPTRIVHGTGPGLRVSFAERPDATLSLDRLAEYVTEEQNPSNAKHVVRVVVELPARRLQEGVAFVDTPGLGSLARSGAQQTMAYLPRCDLGAVLVDAGSTLTPDDLVTVQTLYEAGIPATILLSKADLLEKDQRDKAARYIAAQFQRERNISVPVHPVSVVSGHTSLLDDWFSAEIEPLYARHLEAARTSLRRKTAALREAVQASLRVRADRRQAVPTVGADALNEAEDELRRAAGLFTSEQRRCENLAGGLAVLADAVLHETALRIRRDGDRTATDPQTVVDAFSASLREVVGDRIEAIRLEVADLANRCSKALETASAVLHTPTDSIAPGNGELPPLALTIDGFVAPNARFLRFSRSLQTGYLERLLRQRIGRRLEEALAAHSVLVASWARRAIDRARSEFEERAEPLRTAFGEASRPDAQRLGAEDARGLKRDLAELEGLARQDAPAGASEPAFRRAG